MATYPKQVSFLDRLARVEESLAALARRDRAMPAEVPFYPTAFRTMTYDDSTSYSTQWETVLTPRTSRLSIGLVLIGDTVSSTATGGDWRLLLNDDVIVFGSVPATGTFTFPAHVLDLVVYRALADLKIRIQTRRTSGATTGGRFGTGGCIGSAPRYARLL